MPIDKDDLSPEEESDYRAYREIEDNRALIERLAGYGLPVSHRYQKLLDFADEFEVEHDV